MSEDGMTQQTSKAGGSLSLRSVWIASVMVLVWMAGCLLAASHVTVYSQHLFMLLGFGAILTVFLLHFPRLFLVSIVCVWIGSFAQAWTSASPDDASRLGWGVVVSLAVVVLLSAVALSIRRCPLTRGEMTVIYAAVAIAIPWTMCLKAIIESSASNLLELQQRGEPQMYAWAKEMPWWGPTVRTGDGAPPAKETLDAAAGFARGNEGNVPWRLWWRPLLYWTAMCGSWVAMILGILLLLRKRWIEHERLPFVWATPILHMIRGGSVESLPDPEAPSRPVVSRAQWVMFLAGLGFCVPGILFISPAGEAMTNMTCPPWAGQQTLLGYIDLTDLNLIPGVDIKLGWGPLVLLGLLLFPVDVLLTTAFAFILLKFVLPGLLISLGFTTAKLHIDRFLNYGLKSGGVAGLVFWSLWYNRRTLFGYLQSLRGFQPAKPEWSDELGRRKVILMVLAGTAGFIALGSYAVEPHWYTIHLGSWSLRVPVPVQMLALTLMIVVYTIGQVRMRAEGPPTTYDNNLPSHQLVSLQRDVWENHYTLASKGVPVTSSSWTPHWLQWGFCGQLKSFGPHNSLLEVFKVGHEVGVSARTLAKVIFFTLVLVGLLAPALYLKIIYLYGYENSFGDVLTYSNDYAQWSERSVSYGLLSTSAVFWMPGETFLEHYEVTFDILAGFLLVGLLFHLRREYPRFPISPVGMLLVGQSYNVRLAFGTDNIWFSFLLAGVAKVLIFRWMGVRSFREKVQPALVLMLCGLIFGMMLYLFRHVAMGQGCLR